MVISKIATGGSPKSSGISTRIDPCLFPVRPLQDLHSRLPGPKALSYCSIPSAKFHASGHRRFIAALATERRQVQLCPEVPKGGVFDPHEPTNANSTQIHIETQAQTQRGSSAKFATSPRRCQNQSHLVESDPHEPANANSIANSY